MTGASDLVIGVHLGQGFEVTALCLAECQEREESGRHFLVRLLERIEAGCTYPQVARRLGEIVGELPREALRPIRVDVTGHGPPAADLLAAGCRGASISPVYFNHGVRRIDESDGLRLGKVYLVTRLKALLQSARLHLADRPEHRELARDLREYRAVVAEDADRRDGAFPVGRHDELITALGLAVLTDPVRREWGRVHTACLGEEV